VSRGKGVVSVNPRESPVMEKAEPGTGLKHKVTVQFFGSVRAAAGRSDAEIDIPSDYGVYELLQLLADAYGDAFKTEVFLQDGDSLREDVTVSINGVITERTKVKSVKLETGAVIALFPIFPGGG